MCSPELPLVFGVRGEAESSITCYVSSRTNGVMASVAHMWVVDGGRGQGPVRGVSVPRKAAGISPEG